MVTQHEEATTTVAGYTALHRQRSLHMKTVFFLFCIAGEFSRVNIRGITISQVRFGNCTSAHSQADEIFLTHLGFIIGFESNSIERGPGSKPIVHSDAASWQSSTLVPRARVNPDAKCAYRRERGASGPAWRTCEATLLLDASFGKSMHSL
jgi:hypothetical protein